MKIREQIEWLDSKCHCDPDDYCRYCDTSDTIEFLLDRNELLERALGSVKAAIQDELGQEREYDFHDLTPLQWTSADLVDITAVAQKRKRNEPKL